MPAGVKEPGSHRGTARRLDGARSPSIQKNVRYISRISFVVSIFRLKVYIKDRRKYAFKVFRRLFNQADRNRPADSFLVNLFRGEESRVRLALFFERAASVSTTSPTETSDASASQRHLTSTLPSAAPYRSSREQGTQWSASLNFTPGRSSRSSGWRRNRRFQTFGNFFRRGSASLSFALTGQRTLRTERRHGPDIPGRRGSFPQGPRECGSPIP